MDSVNQRFWSGPAAIRQGSADFVGMAKRVTAPDDVMRPMLFVFAWTNHRFPSAPVAMSVRPLPLGVTGYSGMTPAVGILPTLFDTHSPPCSVNQRLSDGPEVMPVGNLSPMGRGYSCRIEPSVEMTPILFAENPFSVNHKLPSGPATMPYG